MSPWPLAMQEALEGTKITDKLRGPEPLELANRAEQPEVGVR